MAQTYGPQHVFEIGNTVVTATFMRPCIRFADDITLAQLVWLLCVGSIVFTFYPDDETCFVCVCFFSHQTAGWSCVGQ
jgi:hypothetical protein